MKAYNVKFRVTAEDPTFHQILRILNLHPFFVNRIRNTKRKTKNEALNPKKAYY